MAAGFRMEMGPGPGEVAKMLRAFKAFVESQGIPAEARRGMLVVLDDLLANVANYAIAGRADGTATVEAALSADELAVTLCDNGPPFDPTARAAPDTTLSVEDRPIGGLGIHLVRRLVHSARYARTGDLNVLTLTMRLAADGSPGPEGGA